MVGHNTKLLVKIASLHTSKISCTSWSVATTPNIFTARHPKDDRRLYFQSVDISGGVPGPGLRSGGVPGLRFLGGVSRSQIFQGEYQVSDFQGGTWSQILGRVPSLSKGKNF